MYHEVVGFHEIFKGEKPRPSLGLYRILDEEFHTRLFIVVVTLEEPLHLRNRVGLEDVVLDVNLLWGPPNTRAIRGSFQCLLLK